MDRGRAGVRGDTYRQALMEGLGLSEESKTVNRAAVKARGQDEMLEGTEEDEVGWRR